MSTSKHLVFVYGTLKKGFSNHPALGASSKMIAKARVEGFAMYKSDTSQYPVAIISMEHDNKIFGEVYEVDNGTLNLLDDIEGVDRQIFRRITVPVTEEKTGKEYEAYMYIVINPTTFAEILLPAKETTIITGISEWTLKDDQKWQQ